MSPTGTLPSSVTELGKYSLGLSALTSFVVPDHITRISEKAFDGGAFTSIYIGKGLSNFTVDAFQQLTLQSLIVDPENPKFDSRDNCNCIINTALNKLVVGTTATTIPRTVVAIGKNAYVRTKATTITIPSNVTKIIDYAFNSASNVTSVTFEDPTGWQACTNETDCSSPISLNLTDPTQNAKYLNSTYAKKVWEKTN